MSERERLVYEVVRRRRRGDGIRAISRSMHIDRKTVRRILLDAERRREEGDDALEQSIRRSAPRPSKLDSFEADIRALLEQYPDIRATRMHEELCERGFDGSYTIVREHLRRLRPRPKKKPRTPVRTEPGRQAQFDWSPFKLADGTPVQAFSCWLKYSRYQYLCFCTDTRQPTLFRQLRAAFSYHGGVAVEYVTDSMPGVVDRWELEEPVLNLRAVDFAGYYDFSYHIAPRGDGAYKGGVERTFRHAAESLFNARTFHTLEQLNETTAEWIEKANARIHGTTRRRPVDMLEEERLHLKPPPETPFDDREMRYGIVDDFCYVHFDGNQYRAPPEHVGCWVYVRADEEQVVIYDIMAQLLAAHPRAPRGAHRRVPEPPLATPGRRSIPQLLRRFEAFGPIATAFAQRVRKDKRYAGVELARVLELQHQWAAEDLLKAIAHAHRHGAHDAQSVLRILQATAKPRSLEQRLSDRAKKQIRQSIANAPVQQRGLHEYDRLLNPGPVSTKEKRDDDPKTTPQRAASEDP